MSRLKENIIRVYETKAGQFRITIPKRLAKSKGISGKSVIKFIDYEPDKILLKIIKGVI